MHGGKNIMLKEALHNNRIPKYCRKIRYAMSYNKKAFLPPEDIYILCLNNIYAFASNSIKRCNKISLKLQKDRFK